MKKDIKNFKNFINEEIDLRGNEGIPDDFMKNADKQAKVNKGIRPDDESLIGDNMKKLMSLMGESESIMKDGLSKNELDERYSKLEQLAHDIVMSEYQSILDEQNVYLNIHFSKNVVGDVKDLKDVEKKPNLQGFEDENIRKAVDKKKLLNAITQGYGLTTKYIINYSEIYKKGISEIFGKDAEDITDIWVELSEVAQKLDWIIPIDAKSSMMKNAPSGMAGACDIEWVKDEEVIKEEEAQENPEMETEEETEDLPYDKIIITAVGIDFPMLIHEAIKGIFHLLKSGAIKTDEETAKIIQMNTTSFEDEAQDFRYGPVIQSMFRDFIFNCKDSDKYANMDARIYALLALDIDRGGEFSDDDFLKISKSMLESFDLVDKRFTMDFSINTENFENSFAKKKIESMIQNIIKMEQEYERELREYELAEKESDVENGDKFNSMLSDLGVGTSKEVETEEETEEYSNDDLSKMNNRDLQELIDNALDNEDYKEVERISKYIKEGKEIYLRELERIQENKKYKK